MNQPLVSICIPTFNRAGMVGKAIDSALAQTYKNIEVIVVDNASTDNIEEVVASYDDPRLRFEKNKENLGLFGNFNRCIEIYNGAFLHILHSDDYIDRNFTEKCVAFFDLHPDVWLTSTSSRTLSGDNNIQEVKYSENDIVLRAPEGFRRLLSERCFVSCPSVMVRRGLYETVGKFSLEYPYSSDYYQWLKVSRSYDIGYISGAWINYRVGEHSESYRLLFSTPLGYIDTLKIYMRLIGELGDELDDYSKEINISLRRFIRDCLFAGFVRSDKMDNFRPGIFFGMAILAWSVFRPRSFHAFLNKVYDLFLILIMGLIMYFSAMRKLFVRIFFSKGNLY